MLKGQVMRSKSQVLVSGLCWRCYFLEKARDHLSQTLDRLKRSHGSRGEIFDKPNKARLRSRDPSTSLSEPLAKARTIKWHRSATLRKLRRAANVGHPRGSANDQLFATNGERHVPVAEISRSNFEFGLTKRTRHGSRGKSEKYFRQD